MSFLFYGGDTVGLGHTSRLLGIASAMRDLEPDVPFNFVVDDGDARLIQTHGFPFYHIPVQDLLSKGQVAAGMVGRQHALSLWAALVETILNALDPLVLVQDTIIRRPLAKLALQRGICQALIMRQRTDLLGFLHRYRDVVAEMDLIAFPHLEDEVGLIPLPWLPESKVLYTGPLLRRSRRDLNLDTVQKQYGIRPDEFTIVVSNGGGNGSEHFDDPFVATVLAAVKGVEPDLPPFRLIVVTGPLHRQPVTWVDFEGGRLIVRDFEPYLFDLFAAANLVIARGGYNTIHELQELSVPAICVPAERPLESQEKRIHNTGPSIQFATLEESELAEAIRAAGQAAWWRYEPSGDPDVVYENKLALARRLLGLIELPTANERTEARPPGR